MAWEQKFLDLVKEILVNGDERMDRTGTGTRAIFGKQLDIDLREGFPAMTTKKLAWKSMESELWWFIEGSGDERRLCEILHGTRDPAKTTIWTDNAKADYWSPRATYEGDLGRVYGVQWRHWQRNDGTEVDQLAEVIQKIRTNPTDRRIILSAWNVGELNQMALPPCHMMAQFFVTKNRELSCQMYQRSVDTMLGLPFNIASYALLTHAIAAVTDCTVGKLSMCLGDVHIYNDHLEGAEEQITRTPFDVPTLKLTERCEIDDFKMGDAELVGYKHHSPIKMKMST